MTENELRIEVGDAFKLLFPAGHVSWVESHLTSAGFPDADCCANGTIIQIELKIVKTKPKGGISIRSTQYRWFKDRAKAGGNPVMLIGDGGCYYVLPASSISEPDALQHVDHIEGRPHFMVTTAEQAVNAALLIAKFGENVCPIK
jgi:hypothetical protein